MIAKALIFAVFCVQAMRFDNKAELASLSAIISKLKPKNAVGLLGNTTGTVLTEVEESAVVTWTHNHPGNIAKPQNFLQGDDLKDANGIAFAQSYAIGPDRCKEECEARPACGAIGISHPTRGTSAECFLAAPTTDLTTYDVYNGVWDWYNKVPGVDDDVHQTIKDMLVEIQDSIKEEKRKAVEAAEALCKSAADDDVVEEDKDFTDPTAAEGDATQYKDLVGCSANSECETETAREAGIATAAHNQIVIFEGEIAAWESEKGTGQDDKKKNEDEKKAIEDKRDTAQNLHTARMTKFTNAITILQRINNALDESGEIIKPAAAALVSKDEKNVIKEASAAGNVVLMMLEQALTGDVEKDRVVTLKKLLELCISKLTSSKSRELKTHSDWDKLRESEIKSRTDEIKRLDGVLVDLISKISAHKKSITTELTKKDSAVTGLNTKSGLCIAGHGDFISNMADFTRELEAIDEMLEILKDAKLGDQTVKIRDEDDLTKHGVKESVNGEDKCKSGYTWMEQLKTCVTEEKRAHAKTDSYCMQPATICRDENAVLARHETWKDWLTANGENYQDWTARNDWFMNPFRMATNGYCGYNMQNDGTESGIQTATGGNICINGCKNYPYNIWYVCETPGISWNRFSPIGDPQSDGKAGDTAVPTGHYSAVPYQWTDTGEDLHTLGEAAAKCESETTCDFFCYNGSHGFPTYYYKSQVTKTWMVTAKGWGGKAGSKWGNGYSCWQKGD